jgi:sulfoxide reductase heme-binding subunit YedZ
VNEAATAPSRSRRKAAVNAAVAALLALALVSGLAVREPWRVTRELVLCRGTGWVALGALLLCLCMTPLGHLARRMAGRSGPAPELAVARRALGMASGWLALAHGALVLGTSAQANLAALTSWPHLRAGLIALCLLLALLLTSFGPVVAWLRLRFWKELHRLAYVAALLSLQHVLLSPFAPRTLTLVLFCTVFLLSFARLL